MRKSWVEPQIVVDEFCANEYVAACGDTEYGKYKFVCDAPAGTLYYYDNKGRAQKLGGYHPCSDEHEALTSSEFPIGFVDRNYNRTEDQGERVIVWLESNKWGIYNWHATTNLNQASWEIVKS